MKRKLTDRQAEAVYRLVDRGIDVGEIFRPNQAFPQQDEADIHARQAVDQLVFAGLIRRDQYPDGIWCSLTDIAVDALDAYIREHPSALPFKIL